VDGFRVEGEAMKLTSQTFEQKMHCCGDDARTATLTLRTEDGGGGAYLVIEAREWAVDDRKDLERLYALLLKALPEEPVRKDG
jgi:hypothetical protein